MDFDTAADELYGLRPEEFTAARNERAGQARSGGQRDLAGRIRQLRRPTVSAWVVNLLARQADDEISELLELGRQLREAQAERRGEQLRALTERRRQLVAAAVSTGERLARGAGHAVGESAMREVEATLEAALADPDTAEAVRAGRLTTALSYSGLGPVASVVGSGGAAPVADTAKAPRSKKAQPVEGGDDNKDRTHGGQAMEEERRVLSETQVEVRRLERDHEQARTSEAEARAHADAAQRRVTQLEADLDRARKAAETAASELAEAAARTEDVGHYLAAARQQAEQARIRLDGRGDQ